MILDHVAADANRPAVDATRGADAAQRPRAAAAATGRPRLSLRYAGVRAPA